MLGGSSITVVNRLDNDSESDGPPIPSSSTAAANPPQNQITQKYTCPTFTVSDDEWSNAETYFISNYGESKFSKQLHSTIDHSFVGLIVGKSQEIFAIANKTKDNIAPLGVGGHSVIRLAKNKYNEYIALKITGTSNSSPRISEETACKRLGLPFAETFRNYGRTFKTISAGRDKDKPYLCRLKRYVIMKWVPGENLFIALRTHPFTTLQKLDIAIAMCHAVKKLHDLRIIHGDIKTLNFMFTFANNQPHVEAIDFEFSLPLFCEENVAHFSGRGTREYLPPEIKIHERSPFSLSSDIASLGKTLAYDFEFPKEILQTLPVIDNEPTRRPTIDEYIKMLGAIRQKFPMDSLINDLENLTLNTSSSASIPSHKAPYQPSKPNSLPLQGFSSTLENFFNKDIRQEYRSLNRSEPQPARIFRYLGKHGAKLRHRVDTLENLTTLFHALQGSDQPSLDKIQILYAYLRHVTDAIDEENNHYSSNLRTLCSQYQRDLGALATTFDAPMDTKKALLFHLSPITASSAHRGNFAIAVKLINNHAPIQRTSPRKVI